jgi:hypothetical protein
VDVKLTIRIVPTLFLLIGLATAARAQTTFYFPQIADGAFAGGFFTTTIFVANPSSSGSVNVTITFTQSSGAAFNLAFVDGNNVPVPIAGNVLSINAIGPGQSRKIVSTAAIPLTVGFATVTSSAPVEASAVFSQFAGSPGSGIRLSEAAVVPAGTGTSQAIFVDESGNFRTGFAFANPSQTTPANVNFNLIGTTGIQTLTTTREPLQPQTHTAIFVDELFATNGVTTPLAVGHVGSMRIVSDQPVALMALRFEGSLFTTVPPFTFAGLFDTMDQWLNAHALPRPFATLAQLVAGIRHGLG